MSSIIDNGPTRTNRAALEPSWPARQESPPYFHRAEFRVGWVRAPDEKVPVLELIILALTVYWLLSFFGQSIVPCIPHTGGFIYMLAVVIVLLIIIKFLSQV